MKTAKDRSDKFWERFKKESLLKWMASFTVTAVVITVAVVTQTRQQPDVEIRKIEAVGSTLVYETEIIDPSSTIILDSLYLSVEGPLEKHRIPLTLGANIGSQELDYSFGDFTVAIIGSQGFGPKTFKRTSISLSDDLSGAITDYEIINDHSDEGYGYDYRFDAIVYDPENIVTEVNLRFVTVERVLFEMDTYSQEPMQATGGLDDYEKVDSQWRGFTIFQSIYGGDTILIVYLQITQIDNIVSTIATTMIPTPIDIEGDLYIQDVTTNAVIGSAYLYPNTIIGQKAWIELYKDDDLVKEHMLDLSPTEVGEEHYHEMQNTFTFENLDMLTTYSLKLFTSYIDQASGKYIKEEISEQVVTTAPYYTVQGSHIRVGEEIEIVIEIDDPQQIFSNLTYYLYDMTEDYPLYVDFGFVSPTQVDGAISIYETSITLMSLAQYLIEVTAMKTVGNQVYSDSILYSING